MSIQVYIGYDRREDIAYKVCKYSINTLDPDIRVKPLVQDYLRATDIYLRPPDVLASTDFSLTRFYVPAIARLSMNIPRWAVYVDCDTVFLQSMIVHLLPYLDASKAVYVVKHEYVSRKELKMDARLQRSYPRKNWSSFMVFNMQHPKIAALNLEMLNSPHLHESEIGELDKTWNFLVGEYTAPDIDAKSLIEPTEFSPNMLHYTLGGCWLSEEHTPQDYDGIWRHIAENYKRGLE
ncbi:MAG: glycosyltransferase [Gammaproteobacteria bacterium]